MNHENETSTDAETTTDEVVAAPTASRRSFVSKGAIAAAVGAAAGLAMKSPASAADGSTMIVGAGNIAASTTAVSGGSTFRVVGGGSAGSASIYGVADGTGDSLYGVRGQFNEADADGVGVYGYHSSTSIGGAGVKGESKLGTGVYGVNTASISGGIGVHGATGATTGGEGVRGESSGTEGYGVRGRALGTRSIGVSGEAVDGTGVSGTAAAGIGVAGNGPSADLAAVGSGIIRFSTAAATDIGPASSGGTGSLARNSDGSLWYCYESSKWQKVAGGGSGGAFHPVTPFRVYDSRKDVTGRLAADASRTLPVKDARDVATYAVTGADSLPAGATAVAANIVAVATSGTGFLAVNPGGIETIGASALNWVDGQNIGNAGTFTLNDSRELQVIVGPSTSLHLTIDITGYYI